MEKLWSDRAWDEYIEWLESDKKITKKINSLIKDIERNGALKGEGHPEALKHRKACSRHINQEHRLTYTIEDGKLYLLSCKGHYED